MTDTIASVTVIAVPVTPKTVWTFIRLVSASGIEGVGEATLTGQEQAVAAVAERCGGLVAGSPLACA